MFVLYKQSKRTLEPRYISVTVISTDHVDKRMQNVFFSRKYSFAEQPQASLEQLIRFSFISKITHVVQHMQTLRPNLLLVCILSKAEEHSESIL